MDVDAYFALSGFMVERLSGWSSCRLDFVCESFLRLQRVVPSLEQLSLGKSAGLQRVVHLSLDFVMVQ